MLFPLLSNETQQNLRLIYRVLEMQLDMQDSVQQYGKLTIVRNANASI